MKSRFIFLLSLLSVNLILSQDLYVAGDSYIYAKDVVLTVTKDISLEAPTSNIFLRGDAQLVQINDVKNSGKGEISIYQNQTTGIYEYNFWCSPVGVADASSNTNLNFKATNIYDPIDDTESDPYFFTSSYDGTSTQLSNYWIYTLINGEGYYSWNQVFDIGDIPTGYGFTLKGSPNTNNVLDFRGRPNNGTITISCAFDGTDDQPNSGILDTAETLTGNPYPSTLDLKLFLINSTNETSLNGNIYFWEQKAKGSHYLADYEGGYGVYAPGNPVDLTVNGTYAAAAFATYNADGSISSSTGENGIDFTGNNSRRYAAVGQGFIIQSDVISGGGDVTFDNSMRLVYTPEDPVDGAIFAKQNNIKKSTEENKVSSENPTIVPEIRIHTHIDDLYYKENVITFSENTPDNDTYNKFFDGRNINELSSDAYLLCEGIELVIKSINYAEDVTIPLGLKTSKNNTTFCIKVNSLKDVPSDVNVYVFDNENNTYTDVINSCFDITLNTGVYNNRFEITFIENNSLSVDEGIFDDLEVFQNNAISELKIHNPKLLNIKTFSLFDVNGKQVLNDTNMSLKKQFIYSTKPLSDGVYISKITTDTNQLFTKKIIISSSN